MSSGKQIVGVGGSRVNDAGVEVGAGLVECRFIQMGVVFECTVSPQ